MMKIKFTVIPALFFAVSIFLFPKKNYAQLINNGSIISVTNNAVLYANVSFINMANGSVVNNGSIVTDSSLINNSGAALSGNGNYNMQANFTNNGSFNADNSTLIFSGNVTSTIKNKSGNIYKLEIDKSPNKFLSLSDNEQVLNHIVFDNDNNYIHINIYTLTLGANCTISNQSDKRFFITNDSGFLKKKSINKTAFIFPVGFNNSNFNPVTISENGPAADYEVRCLEHAYKNGSSGNIISANGIDVSWNINRSTTTGANATISAKWKNADELTGFNSAKCLLVKYDGTSWNYNANLAGSASGSPYKSISRSNLTSFGYFTVLSSSNTSFANAVDALIANNAELKVYPTIVRNSFNISVPFNKNIQKMNVMVLDGAGKIVWQKQNADFQSQQVSLPSLAGGMYTVLINYDNKNFTQKIIINQ